jgi:hypothetical protein
MNRQKDTFRPKERSANGEILLQQKTVLNCKRKNGLAKHASHYQ